MASGKPSLADLVTQAPNDDEDLLDNELGPSPTRPAAGHPSSASPGPPGARGAPSARRCCAWRCCATRRKSEGKLAAVVPVASPPEHDRRAGPARALAPSTAPSAAVAAAPQEAPAAPAALAPADVPAPLAPASTPAGPASSPPEERDEPAQQPRAAAEREETRQFGQLGPQIGPNIGRKTLVLDLDETLIHSSFREVPSADMVIGVELEGEVHKVYVRKRPGVDHLLVQVSQLYEVVVYTASMPEYANKLLDKLDQAGLVAHRLFRDACTRLSNGYVKDLSRLGRSLKDVIIVDNSPICYSLQPSNAIPIKTWRDDPDDRELYDLVPILQSLAQVEDVPRVLEQVIWNDD